MNDNAPVQMLFVEHQNCDFRSTASLERITPSSEHGGASLCASKFQAGQYDAGQGRSNPDNKSLLRGAGDIGHDLNNLLTVIMGQCEMALSKLPESSPVHDELREVMVAGERAALLTKQLLILGQIGRGQL